MRWVVFDFDWVIHDTLEDLYRIYCNTLEDVDIEDMKQQVFEWNSREHFEKFSEEKKENFQKAWAEHFVDLEMDGRIKYYLESLSKIYELFVISSNSEANLNCYFENNNSADIFRKILWVETHKSKTEKFKMLFEEFDTDNSDIVFITDTLWDIKEANKLYIKTIAVDFGYHEKEKLELWFPYKIASSFDEIFSLLYYR